MVDNIYVYTDDNQPQKVSLTNYNIIKSKQTKKWVWNNNRVTGNNSPYSKNKKKYKYDLYKVTSKEEKYLVNPVINFIYNMNDLYNELLLLFKRELTKKEMINEIKQYYYQDTPLFQDDTQIDRIIKNISHIYYLNDIDKYHTFNHIDNNIQGGGSIEELEKENLKEKLEEEEEEKELLSSILNPPNITKMDWLFHFLWVVEQKIGIFSTFPMDMLDVSLDSLRININVFITAMRPFVDIGITMIPAIPVVGPFLAPYSILLNVGYQFISTAADKIISFIDLLINFSRKQYKFVFINLFNILPDGRNILSFINTFTYYNNKYIQRFIQKQKFLILFLNQISKSIEYINGVNVEKYEEKEKENMKSYYDFQNIPNSLKDMIQDTDKINLDPFPYILNKLDKFDKNIDNIYSVNHTYIKKQNGGKYTKSSIKNKKKYKYSRKKK